jgi:hypothetical protein
MKAPPQSPHGSLGKIRYCTINQTPEGVVRATERDSLDETPGPSSAPPRSCGGSSTKNKAARILANAPRPRPVWIGASGK